MKIENKKSRLNKVEKKREKLTANQKNMLNRSDNLYYEIIYSMKKKKKINQPLRQTLKNYYIMG